MLSDGCCSIGVRAPSGDETFRSGVMHSLDVHNLGNGLESFSSEEYDVADHSRKRWYRRPTRTPL